MSTKKSLMRSQVAPLLFEECRIFVKRFKYEVPHIRWIRSLGYMLDSAQLYKDLPLSDSEFCSLNPDVALDLGYLLALNNLKNDNKKVM